MVEARGEPAHNLTGILRWRLAAVGGTRQQMLDNTIILGFLEEQIAADVGVRRAKIQRPLGVRRHDLLGDHAQVILGLHIAHPETQASPSVSVSVIVSGV
jgi:hypothetical protein